MPENYLMDVFYITQAVFCALFLLVFLPCFFDAGFQFNRKKVIFFLSPIVLAALEYFIHSEIYRFAVYLYCDVALVFIAIYDYKGKKWVGIIRFLGAIYLFSFIETTIAMMAAYYFLPGFSMESLEISPNELQFYYAFSAACSAFFFILTYFGAYKRGVAISLDRKYIRRLLILYAFLLLVYFTVSGSYEKTSTESVSILAATTILLAILLPVFICALRISTHYQQRVKHQEECMQLELEHFRQYMCAQEETRRFRHDIRNNLLCMNEMVASGDKENLQQYLKDLLEITDTLSFKYVSGDELLDSILNSKAPYMEQQNIRFELDGVVAGGLPWKPADICSVFANAMDNAIEACEKLPPENRHISMRIKSTPQFWLITLENSVAGVVNTKRLFQKNSGYTSKADTENHGIGTYNMKQTVESYGAIIKAECTEQLFTLEIMIDKSK